MPKMLGLMTTPHQNNYGYGTITSDHLGPYPVYFHDGRIYGYRSFMLYEPQRDIHIIILSHFMDTKVYEIVKEILNIIGK